MKKHAAILAIILLVASIGSVSAAKKVLFYEIGTAGGYTIESGYSKFSDELRNKGYDVASITKGELTKEKLKGYDVVAIQELGRKLSTEEMSAVLWFVMQKGGGLFINGGSPDNANQLTVLFGVTVDDGMLVDTTDPIPGGTSNSHFVLDKFITEDVMRSIRQGVSKIGFYQGHGLILSGNAKAIVMGDEDTYSDTMSFPSGSQPAVGAAAMFGNGLIFILSDADVLSNEHLDEFDNKVLGTNIVDWLAVPRESLPSNTTEELSIIIGELKLSNARFRQDNDKLQQENQALKMQNNALNAQINALNSQIEELKSGRIGSFTAGNIAIMFLGVCILIVAIVLSARKGGKAEGEDLLGELGYEFEEEKPGREKEESLDEEVLKETEEEDTEKKELERMLDKKK